ncbi:MAG: 16S rRNA (cytidine(1402)-2'-O)-methyltransferase [Bacilli bacterium]|nr:16S rRNA (cytidine(1402)-2'-O)-methyltransferase [Bacilli bacterium]
MNDRELNFFGSKPLLYLVATPIGNLGEFSPRALEIIKEMDYIGAEDTRHSGELLASFGIKKPMISCHEHNEEEAASKIIALLKEGKKVAYMSDAGYPAISDPGQRLVKRLIQEGIKVSTISGANAALNALAASGLDSRHFYFHGFLPAKEGERKRELSALKAREETLIFYEAPHRIEKTLKDLAEILGPREATLARELTKTHEEFLRGNLEELSQIDPATLKGEMVIVVEGNREKAPSYGEEEVLALLKEEISRGLKAKDAAKEIAEKVGWSKNQIYALYLQKKDD